jgi:hypothetical protein
MLLRYLEGQIQNIGLSDSVSQQNQQAGVRVSRFRSYLFLLMVLSAGLHFKNQQHGMDMLYFTQLTVGI